MPPREALHQSTILRLPRDSCRCSGPRDLADALWEDLPLRINGRSRAVRLEPRWSAFEARPAAVEPGTCLVTASA